MPIPQLKAHSDLAPWANGTDISKNQSLMEQLPIRPLNPPIWGTSEQLEVPQIGGFRGRIGA
jgi:hypothetical protein